MKPPLSAIMKEMAFTVLRRSEQRPSSEAAHAALLLAHIAWNRRTDSPTPDYRQMLREFEGSNPNFWDELKSADPDQLIAELAAYREFHHQSDERYLVVCGMRGNNVHAEWL
jgi:hypothetical protein